MQGVLGVTAGLLQVNAAKRQDVLHPQTGVFPSSPEKYIFRAWAMKGIQRKHGNKEVCKFFIFPAVETKFFEK